MMRYTEIGTVTLRVEIRISKLEVLKVKSFRALKTYGNTYLEPYNSIRYERIGPV